jgi:hypothetical protein
VQNLKLAAGEGYSAADFAAPSIAACNDTCRGKCNGRVFQNAVRTRLGS